MDQGKINFENGRNVKISNRRYWFMSGELNMKIFIIEIKSPNDAVVQAVDNH